jgi:hypothetical protein
VQDRAMEVHSTLTQQEQADSGACRHDHLPLQRLYGWMLK